MMATNNQHAINDRKANRLVFGVVPHDQSTVHEELGVNKTAVNKFRKQRLSEIKAKAAQVAEKARRTGENMKSDFGFIYHNTTNKQVDVNKLTRMNVVRSIVVKTLGKASHEEMVEQIQTQMGKHGMDIEDSTLINYIVLARREYLDGVIEKK